LSRLIELLREHDFTPLRPEPSPTPEATRTTSPQRTPTPTATPTPPPPAPESDAIRDARVALQQRGIQTSYTIDPSSYRADVLTFSGSFPNYDDVEAVYARDGLAVGQNYQIVAYESNAISAELRQVSPEYPDDVVQRYLQLPETVTPRTNELAFALTADALNTYDMAVAVETWLRETIAYAENVEFPPEDQDVVDFVLFDSRQGYCEYYASAFVVMMRTLGVPARMVTGLFPAERDADAGGFLYRERNAHAWPEVYFAGYGWVPFEPTAARSQFNREPIAPSIAPGAIDPESGGEGNLLPDDEDFLGSQRPFERGGVPASGTTQAEPVSRAEWVIRFGVLGLMLLTVVVAFLWLRGMRGLTPATQLYTKLARGASWSGVRPEPAMTPHEYAQDIARTVPGSRGPVTYLADVYVRERYGNRPPAQMEMLRARQAWLRLRGLLVKHLILRLRPWRSGPVEDADEGDW
jgi:transglutaminase-like putative cysteine protease